LEEDGIIKRTVFPELSPRVAYELTESGEELMPICDYLQELGSRHRGAIQKEADATIHEQLLIGLSG
jgi:DNA-binding HxlR family transcriptional regulator